MNNKKGFTLIEIIVSTAIFTLVVTIAIGALTSLNKVSREARALRIIMDNANSVVDSMARTVRMGIRFDGACNSDCTCAGNSTSTVNDTSPALINPVNPKLTGNTCLKFYGPNYSSALIDTRYRFNSTNKSVERSLDGGAFYPMTAPEVEVSDMRFFVTGSGLDDDQPIITMLMTGVAKASNKSKEFTIQTSISPRTPNLHIIEP